MAGATPPPSAAVRSRGGRGPGAASDGHDHPSTRASTRIATAYAPTPPTPWVYGDYALGGPKIPAIRCPFLTLTFLRYYSADRSLEPDIPQQATDQGHAPIRCRAIAIKDRDKVRGMPS